MKIAIQKERLDTNILHFAILRYGLYKKLNLVKFRYCWEYGGFLNKEGELSASYALYYSNRSECYIPVGDKRGLIFDEDNRHISFYLKCNDKAWIAAIEHFPYFGMKIVEIPNNVEWALVRDYDNEEERYIERIEEKHRVWD